MSKEIVQKGICVLHQTEYKGSIIFHEIKENSRRYCKIIIDLEGLPPGKRGFHIHEKGNLLHGCASLCAHYNPHNKTHGGLNEKNSHMGDLGNIIVNKNGKIKYSLIANNLRLTGKYSIIGRSVVIHEDEDDLGKGDNEDSLITGNAGKRIACGIIGYF